MKLTRVQRRVLTIMRDDDQELVYSRGGGWWLDLERTNGKLGLGLLRLMLISPDSWASDDYQCYWINESGRRALEGLPPYFDCCGNYHDSLASLIVATKRMALLL